MASYEKLLPAWILPNDTFRVLFTKGGTISKHKAIEFNMYRSAVLFSFMWTYRSGGDHPGLSVQIGLCSFEIELHWYDVRHAEDIDNEKNRINK